MSDITDDITLILDRLERGETAAADELLPLVYEELRKLASTRMTHERPDDTLQATALVHEAYLRLVATNRDQPWDNRGHFFSAAAQAMRRILIDRARDKSREKRGASRQRIDLDAIALALDTPPEELLALDEVLEQLDAAHPECGDLVRLRFFAGLSLADAAATLGIPPRSADRNWAFARAWLHRRLSEEKAPHASA